MMRFPGKLGLQQRVLPTYRAPFFDLLAEACDGGMSLFTGSPLPVEGISTTDRLRVARYLPGKNIHLSRGGLYSCYQIGLLSWLKDWDPDALIVEANPRYLSTPAAVRWMHGHGRPVVGWGLGASPLSGLLAGFRNQRRALFLKQFDALIAYSQRGADEYAALGFPREKIFVAHNSVATRPASALPRRPSAFNPQPTILFVGRLQRRKQIDSLLRACAQLPEKPRLIIVGDGPERERLEGLARELYPSTEFAGARHGAELSPYFEAADLFVLPGTGGLAVQQAMSYGLPVIVAQGDGTQDDLVRSENGWQIPPDDFEALLFVMKEALSDVARLRRMGDESYRIVREEINLEKMVETFVTTLNALT
ncbi:MAG: glycosyltransferase family 4 protein [Chloroflexota bacterium]|nr:glycosyltransferase family 4 protein [Chloroflexota bacterium]